jgi:hypothetical protein
VQIPESTLDARVQDLVKLICNVQSMTDTLVELNFDVKKMPLGAPCHPLPHPCLQSLTLS